MAGVLKRAAKGKRTSKAKRTVARDWSRVLTFTRRLSAGMVVLAVSGVSFLSGYRFTAQRYEESLQARTREDGYRRIRNQLEHAEEAVAREEARARSLGEWLLADVDPDVPMKRQKDGRLPTFYRRSFLSRQETGIWSAIVVLRQSEGMGRPWLSRMATAADVDPARGEALESWSTELLESPDDALLFLKLAPGESLWRMSRGRLWWVRRSDDANSEHVLLAVADASPIPASLRGWVWRNAPVTPPILDSFNGDSRTEKDPALFPRTSGKSGSPIEGVREDELEDGFGRRIRGLTAVGPDARWIIEWGFDTARYSKDFVEIAPKVDLGFRLFGGAGGVALLTFVLAGLLAGRRSSIVEKHSSAPVQVPPPEQVVSTEPAPPTRPEVAAVVSEDRALPAAVAHEEGPGNEAWWVNNGTRLLGPLSVAEIVRLLLAQELDFDCDCRGSGHGESVRLDQSRIFGNTIPDPDHRYWLFDGKQLHGPLSEAFLRNSHAQGWIEPGSLLCDSSTIRGWQAIDRWMEGQPIAASVTESPEAPRDPGSTAA